MRREDIISKGLYQYPQLPDLVSVKQFIILRDRKEKCLLLRMTNDRNERLTGLTLRVRQFNAKGDLIGTCSVEQNGVAYRAGAAFNVNQRIVLAEACVDFKVDVVSVTCGSYLHSVKGGEIVTSYIPEEKPAKAVNESSFLKKMKGERHAVSSRTYNPKKLILWICCTIVFWAALFTAIQLVVFMRTETVFTLDQVEYTFETDDHVEEVHRGISSPRIQLFKSS